MRCFSVLQRDGLGMVYLVTVLTQVAVGTLPPLLPDLQREFRVSVAELSLVVAAFAASRLILDLPVGTILDRIPVSPALVGSALVVAVGGFLGAVAGGLEVVVLARALMGAGSTVTILTTQLALSRASIATNRGRLLGYYQAAAIAGAAASPVLAGVVAAFAGWRVAFALSTATALVIVGVVLVVRRPSTAATLSPVVPPGPCPIISAEAPNRATANRAFTAVAAANIAAFSLHFFSGGIQETVVPLHGGLRLGLDSSALGAIASLGTVAFFGATFASGHLADRVGRGKALVMGLGVMAVGLLILDQAGTTIAYAVSVLVMAAGRSCGCIPLALLLDHVPPTLWGRAMGVNRFLSDVGMAGGPLILGWLVDTRGYSVAVNAAAVVLLLTAVSVVVGLRRPASNTLRLETQ